MYVSATAVCDFPTLAAAVAGGAAISEIRLVGPEAVLTSGLFLLNRSVRIAGGYPACGAPFPTGKTAVRADFTGAPVVFAQGNVAGALNVELVNLILVDGDNPTGSGGGLQVFGQGQVTLRGVEVHDNFANFGGGVHVSGSGGQLDVNLLDDTRIGNDSGQGNGANFGAGVFCNNARMRLGHMQVLNNVASQEGGGIRASNCTILTTNASGPTRIEHNRARDGGGIYANNGSSLMLESRSGQKVSVSHNEASVGAPPQRGGGIFIAGADTFLRGDGIWIDHNLARSFGGGLMIQGSSAELGRGVASCMVGDDRCSSVSGNQVRDAAGALAGSAAGIFVAGSGSPSLSLAHTRVSANAALDLAAMAAGDAAAITLDNVLISDHTSNARLLGTFGNARISADFVTLAGNSFVGAAINNSSAAPLALEMRRSIFVVAAGNSHVQGGGIASYQCINTGSGAALGGDGHDPGFFDAPGGVYRLAANSQNLDRCQADGNESPVDLSGLPRNIDHPLTPNNPGTLDRGAYENPERIFASGFES